MLDRKVRGVKRCLLETYTTNRPYKLLGNDLGILFYQNPGSNFFWPVGWTKLQLSDLGYWTTKKHSELQAHWAKTSKVTPSFYCSFWMSYIWLTFVPSLKKLWMVYHFQVNYLNMFQSVAKSKPNTSVRCMSVVVRVALENQFDSHKVTGVLYSKNSPLRTYSFPI